MEAARRAPHRPALLRYDYSLFAPADATAPKVCRDFVRAVLLTLDRAPLVLPATLCTSELVTNVHLHTKGATMLRVQLTPARLRVSVYDESHDPPRMPEATPTACRGRRPGGAVRERGVVRAAGGGGAGRIVPSSPHWVTRSRFPWSALSPHLP
ncbi:ATP-binding protein [Streptomyces sp. NBC_01728]|uniref:ATP-binding protein n=1 Tax=unclassified Streptomyces TaxID=2593676 RepID=UPI00224FF43A|nr:MULTISPECIES: ATP-binding protein [unclassified Streptomyces]MCX4455659.1 ATP-binding protein [Streptomyces sp. NBC_01719]MCX4495019.1 ATP-binding protein [Streptomyces sp. NBC_01728]